MTFVTTQPEMLTAAAGQLQENRRDHGCAECSRGDTDDRGGPRRC